MGRHPGPARHSDAGRGGIDHAWCRTDGSGRGRAPPQEALRRVLEGQLAALAAVLQERTGRLAWLLAGFLASLWILVPVHELLHAAGCVATGGLVTRLEISPVFGGRLLERYISWISAGGEYAGRLSGFDPAGDLSYFVTVALPHVLLATIGAALARRAARRHSALGFGSALAAALQPLASLSGDAYEAASIPITRLARFAGFTAALDLRGDDVAKVAVRAASIGSPAAWAVFVAGSLGGVALVALLLVVSGGVAPRPEPADSRGWTRRDLFRGLLGVAASAAGAWILKRIFLPGRLDTSGRATLETLLDTLIPDGEFPGHRATGVLPKLLSDLEGSRQTRRALVEGIDLLDRGARRAGSRSFRDLPAPRRAELVREIADAEEGSLPRFFYQSVRNRAMEIHYSSPETWNAVGFTHAPQPDGYPDFAEKPGA